MVQEVRVWTINMYDRGIGLHQGQTEELMLPETPYPMLFDQLDAARRASSAQQPSRPASSGISEDSALPASGVDP
jgi:hypothetical protein